MAKFCKNCGAPLEEEVRFCPSCGSKIEEAVSETVNVETVETTGGPGVSNNPTRNTAGITQRSVALCIIFSIITCGIYGLYWLCKLNDEMNQLSGETNATGSGLVILFTLITCGIYGWYWCYKKGEQTDQLTGSDSNKILFIVLAIFGFSIVNYAIMQDVINKQIA